MSRSSNAGNAVTKPKRTTKNGDTSAASSNGKATHRVVGRPFSKGNTYAKQRKKPMSEEEFRRVACSAMTKTGVRAMVRRLQRVAVEGSGRDCIAASRLILSFAAIDEAPAGSTNGKSSGAASTMPATIVMPPSPER